MSFYPILSAPGCYGQTTLYNFPSNNWEDRSNKSSFVNLTWAENGNWYSTVLTELAFGAMRVFSHKEISNLVPDYAIPLLSLSAAPLPECSENLPVSVKKTNMPNWRATLSLISPLASTCYQGELDPFPAPGSLLTFAPFMQFGDGIENYLLLLNLEKNPQPRMSTVEIYDTAVPGHRCGNFEVLNNALSIVSLDGLGITPDTLPAIICKGMSGIPLYFSKSADSAYLSLEHTHPPASYVIHGRRGDAQKLLKSNWFSILGKI